MTKKFTTFKSKKISTAEKRKILKNAEKELRKQFPNHSDEEIKNAVASSVSPFIDATIEEITKILSNA